MNSYTEAARAGVLSEAVEAPVVWEGKVLFEAVRTCLSRAYLCRRTKRRSDIRGEGVAFD